MSWLKDAVAGLRFEMKGIKAWDQTFALPVWVLDRNSPGVEYKARIVGSATHGPSGTGGVYHPARIEYTGDIFLVDHNELVDARDEQGWPPFEWIDPIGNPAFIPFFIGGDHYDDRYTSAKLAAQRTNRPRHDQH